VLITWLDDHRAAPPSMRLWVTINLDAGAKAHRIEGRRLVLSKKAARGAGQTTGWDAPIRARAKLTPFLHAAAELSGSWSSMPSRPTASRAF